MQKSDAEVDLYLATEGAHHLEVELLVADQVLEVGLGVIDEVLEIARACSDTRPIARPDERRAPRLKVRSAPSSSALLAALQSVAKKTCRHDPSGTVLRTSTVTLRNMALAH